MGFLDFLKKDKPKIEKEKISSKDDLVEEEKISPKDVATKDIQVLSDKIKLNFVKLNLDKPEVLADTVFLLDVSGSMNEKVGKERKIDHLRDVMSSYPNANKFCFSDDVYNKQNIPEPNGSTNLAKGFRYLQNTEFKAKRVVLVSDGEPDNESSALNEANKLFVPVDIIYIGDKGSRGERFMERLASSTGGKHFIVS
jgi:hypothetical protein